MYVPLAEDMPVFSLSLMRRALAAARFSAVTLLSDPNASSMRPFMNIASSPGPSSSSSNTSESGSRAEPTMAVCRSSIACIVCSARFGSRMFSLFPASSPDFHTPSTMRAACVGMRFFASAFTRSAARDMSWPTVNPPRWDMGVLEKDSHGNLHSG